MRTNTGHTLLELLTAIAIAGILAALVHTGFQYQMEKSNFRTMKEFGMELAIKQQLHRQRYGRYAQEVASIGNSSSNRLVIPAAATYVVQVDAADFRRFHAEVTPHNPEAFRLPEDCKILLVHSDMGTQRFESLARKGVNTSERCVPHG